MTKEEVLETLIRMARDKVAGSQGVIIMVAQDGQRGFDMTVAAVNVDRDGVETCARALLKHTESKANGLLIVPGKH